MAKYGPDDFKVEFDITDGGALQDMSAHVDTINGVDIEGAIEESHTFGDSWAENLFTGIRKMNEVTLGGKYDDTASTGPNAVFNHPGANTQTRTLKLTWGGSKDTSVETNIKNFRRFPALGGLTRYEVVLAPTGTVTEN